jgi:hypothetical protein
MSNNNNPIIPDRVSPDRQWEDLLKRIKSSAKSHASSVAFMQINLVVDASGRLRFWTPPKIVPLEPRLNMDFDKLMQEVSQEDMEALLRVIVQTG